VLAEPAAPLADRVHGVHVHGEDPGDRRVARAVRRRKHDPCPQHVPVFAGGTASAGDQQTPLGVGQNDEMRGRDRHEHGCAAPGAQGGADTRNLGDDEPVPATPPDSTKRSLRSRLITRQPCLGPDGEVGVDVPAGVAPPVADPGTPYYSLLHPMWATHYGTYDHLARVQEWSLIGDDEDDEISPRVSSRAGP